VALTEKGVRQPGQGEGCPWVISPSKPHKHYTKPLRMVQSTNGTLAVMLLEVATP